MNTFAADVILGLSGSVVAILALLAILDRVPDGEFQGRLLLLWFASLVVVPVIAKKGLKYLRSQREAEP